MGYVLSKREAGKNQSDQRKCRLKALYLRRYQGATRHFNVFSRRVV